jgi:hypothetical protein
LWEIASLPLVLGASAYNDTKERITHSGLGINLLEVLPQNRVKLIGGLQRRYLDEFGFL